MQSIYDETPIPKFLELIEGFKPNFGGEIEHRYDGYNYWKD